MKKMKVLRPARLERIPNEWNIPGTGEIVDAFPRSEAIELIADGVPSWKRNQLESGYGTSRNYAGHKTNSAHRAKADLDGRKLRLSNAAPVGSLTSVQRSGRLRRPLVEVKDPHIETALEQILYAMTPQESEPRERPRPLVLGSKLRRGGAVIWQGPSVPPLGLKRTVYTRIR